MHLTVRPPGDRQPGLAVVAVSGPRADPHQHKEVTFWPKIRAEIVVCRILVFIWSFGPLVKEGLMQAAGA